MLETKKIKMVVSDMDGTLLNEEFAITTYSATIIKEIQKKGILFVIASGRSHYMMKNYYEVLDMLKFKNSYMVGLNGIELYKFKDHSIDKYPSLSAKEGKEISESILLLNKTPVLMYDDKTIIVYNNDVDKAVQMANFLSQKYQGAFANIQVKELQAISNETINKICVLVELQNKEQITTILSKKVDNHITVLRVGEEWLEIMPKNINKAVRIQQIMEQENIQSDEIIIFGDSQNDIEMLLLTKNSYAMENASDEVKQYAKNIAGSHSTDGVAKELEKLLL